MASVQYPLHSYVKLAKRFIFTDVGHVILTCLPRGMEYMCSQLHFMWRQARERACHLLRFWGIRLVRFEMMCKLIIYCLAASIYPLIHRHCTLDIFHDGYCGRSRSPLQRARNYRNDTLWGSFAPSQFIQLHFPPLLSKRTAKLRRCVVSFSSF